MFYIINTLSPSYHQMSLDELFGADEVIPSIINDNFTNTHTRRVEHISDAARKNVSPDKMIADLAVFNRRWDYLREKPRDDLYRSFKIPKKTRGFREINAPQDELMTALRELKMILENIFVPKGYAVYHTSAFAYLKGRNPYDCVTRHQQNESKWKVSLDFHDFFGSVTLDFTMRMFSSVYPYCLITENPRGREELEKALELGFLHGGLPQGTPLSPFITNVIMVPIDFTLANTLRNFDQNSFVYTRYADDIFISSKFNFDYKKVQGLVLKTIKDFDAPFTLNCEKTKYGSSAGSNWILGLMLNKDNAITVGAKNKRRLKAQMSSYLMDRKNGVPWSVQEIQEMEGYRSYVQSIEKETMTKIIEYLNKRFSADYNAYIKADLKAG